VGHIFECKISSINVDGGLTEWWINSSGKQT